MKALKNIITLAALIALPLTAMTAEPEKQPDAKIHKVVFEVAIDGAETWLGSLRILYPSCHDAMRQITET